jgi:hypothetical protein
LIAPGQYSYQSFVELIDDVIERKVTELGFKAQQRVRALPAVGTVGEEMPTWSPRHWSYFEMQRLTRENRELLELYKVQLQDLHIQLQNLHIQHQVLLTERTRFRSLLWNLAHLTWLVAKDPNLVFNALRRMMRVAPGLPQHSDSNAAQTVAPLLSSNVPNETRHAISGVATSPSDSL